MFTRVCRPKSLTHDHSKRPWWDWILTWLLRMIFLPPLLIYDYARYRIIGFAVEGGDPIQLAVHVSDRSTRLQVPEGWRIHYAPGIIRFEPPKPDPEDKKRPEGIWPCGVGHGL